MKGQKIKSKLEREEIAIDGKIGTKMPGIGESIFSTMTQLANQHDAINLSQGFPNFDSPPELINLVNKHMKAGHNQYPPMPGVMALREMISEKTREIYGVEYNPETEVTVTAGATQAIFTAITALVREGEEVIVIEPAYDSYVPSIMLNKGNLKYLQLSPPEFKINWNEVKKLISFHTRMIIINTPHNPTGTVLTREDMEQLEKIVTSYDIFVLSDEVYEHIIYDGREHQSVCRYPRLRDRSFAIFSFGKTYHTTGWKIGYVLASEALTKEFRKVYQYLMFGAATPMQYAFADFLREKEHYLKLGEFYQAKRDLFLQAISASRFKSIPSEGTYFQCVDYSGISDEKDVDFAKSLIRDFKIASIPISVFYHQKIDNKILRFCFAKDDETLKKAGDILCKI